jgi:hypothetical protein
MDSALHHWDAKINTLLMLAIQRGGYGDQCLVVLPSYFYTFPSSLGFLWKFPSLASLEDCQQRFDALEEDLTLTRHRLSYSSCYYPPGMAYGQLLDRV